MFWGRLARTIISTNSREFYVGRGSLMAGQSVGLVGEIKPVAAIIEELARNTGTELRRVREALA